jgi:hypothetical protein
MFDEEDGRVLKEWLRSLAGIGRNDDAGCRIRPYLRDGDACAILRLVLENPGITADQLARRSKIGRTTVAGYLNGMTANGLVVAEKEEWGTGYHIAEDAKAAVVEFMPLNYQCPGLQRE